MVHNCSVMGLDQFPTTYTGKSVITIVWPASKLGQMGPQLQISHNVDYTQKLLSSKILNITIQSVQC